MLWLASFGAFAAMLAPPHIAAALPDAHLSGAGTYRWFGLRIYDAQLWVGTNGYHAADAPFALDLRYAHHFEGKEIARQSVKEMEKQDAGSAEQRAAWLTQMLACFPDVDDGTHLTGIYLPGSGVRYYRDGQALCTIADAQFAGAFFGIWLNPRTPDKSLRADLLGLEK